MGTLPKLTLNVFLSSIIDAKIARRENKGKKKSRDNKGLTDNGEIFVRLLAIIADCKDGSVSKEASMFKYLFDSNKINMTKFVSAFLPKGKKLPMDQESLFDSISIHDFERKVDVFSKAPKWSEYKLYLVGMGDFCDQILDKTKADSFVYTLLELINRDDDISTIYYGNHFIPKSELTGDYAHPKNLCVEALLLGVLYHVLKNPAQADTAGFQLLSLPDRLKFYVTWLGNRNNANLWDDGSNYTRLKALFDTTNNRDLRLALSENSHRSFAKTELRTIFSEQHYPLQIASCYIDEEINLNTIIEDMDKNIFLYGAGGVGKTTTLLDLLQKSPEDTDLNTPSLLCFSLNQYEAEIRKQIRPSESCWILIHILLKYYYQNVYKTYEAMTAQEDEKKIHIQLNELQTILEEKPEEVSPQYILLLDGINELSGELQDELVEELSYICEEWHNIRLIITGRVVPQYSLFEQFEQLEIRGIPDSDRDAALSEFSDYPGLLKNTKLMEVLKIPLFLSLYIEGRKSDSTTSLNTRGEILDAYVAGYKQSAGNYDKKVVQFLVQFVLPFVAKVMVDNDDFIVNRGDLLEVVDKAYDTYLMNERVYQSVIAPLKIRKAALVECRSRDDFVELLFESISFLTLRRSYRGGLTELFDEYSGFPKESDDYSIGFTHQYFRDYFAAKYILNLIEMLEMAYGKNHTEEKCQIFHEFDLGSVWFDGSAKFEFYELIGEICGDYKNVPDSEGDFYYRKTLLDKLLDMCREFSVFRATENVINTMSIVRNGIICGADFSKTSLPLHVPSNVKFSLNGEHPSNFWGCKMLSDIGAYESEVYCAAYAPDGSSIFFGMSDGYVFMWNLLHSEIVWEQNLAPYMEEGLNFENAAFSESGTHLTLVSGVSAVVLDANTGAIICSESGYMMKHHMEYARLSPNGRYWIVHWSGFDGHFSRLVDLETGKAVPLGCSTKLPEILYDFEAAFSHDSRYIFQTVDDNMVELRTTTGESVRTKEFELTDEMEDIDQILFTPDDSGCLICMTKKIVLWDLESDEVSVVFAPEHIKFFCDIYFSPDGKYASVRYKTDDEVEQTVLLHVPTGVYEPLPYLYAEQLVFSPDSKFFIVSTDEQVLLYDIEKKTYTTIETEEEYDILAVAFAPDSKHFLLGDAQYMITGEKEELSFRKHFNHYKGCDFMEALFFHMRKTRRYSGKWELSWINLNREV